MFGMMLPSVICWWYMSNRILHDGLPTERQIWYACGTLVRNRPGWSVQPD